MFPIVFVKYSHINDHGVVALSAINYDSFIEGCSKKGISTETITVEEATRLVQSENGIGVGCYTSCPSKPSEEALRRRTAAKRMVFVADIAGFIQVTPPLMLE